MWFRCGKLLLRYWRHIPFLSVAALWPGACNGQSMILMVWSSNRAGECARIIEKTLLQPVQIVETLHHGCERLGSDEYSAVVLDQWITEAEPELTTVLFDQLRTAVPVFVNFGI